MLGEIKKILVICLLGFALVSCATSEEPRRARYPNSVSPAAQTEFSVAKGLYRSSRFPEADSAFAALIADHPYTEITDRSLFFRAEIAFGRHDYSGALGLYRKSYSRVGSPMITPMAKFKAGLSLYKLKRYGEAITELESIERANASAILRLRIDSLAVVASNKVGAIPASKVIWYLFVLDDYSDGAAQRVGEVSGEELVAENDALSEVRRWVEDPNISMSSVEMLPLAGMKGKRSGGYASYKYAYLLHTTGRSDEAAQRIKNYLTGYPKHEYYASARLLAMELGGEFGSGAGISIGVILPLTGRYAVYGESVLHGIECAVGIFGSCTGPAGMTLIVRDSTSTSLGATRAVDELNDAGVVAIVGPLMSSSAVVAAGRAQELGIPLISLSQRNGVIELGDFIFRNSVSPASEVDAVVEYSITQKMLKRFFILYPNNRKGAEYERLFTEKVEELGGKVVSTHSYAPNEMEFAVALRSVGDNGSSFDAVFIPDSSRVVGYIAPTLALSGIEGVKLLGISRWDEQGLVDRGGKFVDGSIFVNSFYKKAHDAGVISFIKKFKETYGIEPTLLEALGFDATRAIIIAAQEMGSFHRETMRDSLTRISGFHGVSGLMGFNLDGDARRKLTLLTVKNGAIVPMPKE